MLEMENFRQKKIFYKEMQLKCPAKINLFLNIVGKKSDGYHQLESIFVPIELSDFLEIKPSANFKLTLNGNYQDKIDFNENILLKILDYFKKNYQIVDNFSVNLQKNIPVGAGLGGGSSDGTGFIKMLNKIFNLKLDKQKMQEIALNFGSDLPFFFEESPCMVKGRGELVTRLPSHIEEKFKNYKILLINPNINLSTKLIFENYQKLIKANKINYSKPIDTENLFTKNLDEIFKISNNDLVQIAFSMHKILPEILCDLQNFSPAFANMTGSGSTMFAIFDKFNENLNKCQNFLLKKYPNYFINISNLQN